MITTVCTRPSLRRESLISSGSDNVHNCSAELPSYAPHTTAYVVAIDDALTCNEVRSPLPDFVSKGAQTQLLATSLIFSSYELINATRSLARSRNVSTQVPLRVILSCTTEGLSPPSLQEACQAARPDGFEQPQARGAPQRRHILASISKQLVSSLAHTDGTRADSS